MESSTGESANVGGQTPDAGADALKAAAAQVRTPTPGTAPGAEPVPPKKRGGARPGAGRKPGASRATTAGTAAQLDAKAQQLQQQADAIRATMPGHTPEDFLELSRVVLAGIASKTRTTPPKPQDPPQLAAALVPLADKYMPHVIARVGPGTPLLLFLLTYGAPRVMEWGERTIKERRAAKAAEELRRASADANTATGADLGDRGFPVVARTLDGRVVADADPDGVVGSRAGRGAAG